jgi:hypothetical protein
MNSKNNLFFFVIKKLYKNGFLFTAILSDILTSNTSSIVASHITLRKYKVLLWHERCRNITLRKYKVLLSHERCRPAPVYS